MVGDFFMCVLQYLLIMVVLAAIGGLGGFVGVRLRRKKDAKAADLRAENTVESATDK